MRVMFDINLLQGAKTEKNGASGENRTQGSISLLRLLKDNLAI